MLNVWKAFRFSPVKLSLSPLLKQLCSNHLAPTKAKPETVDKVCDIVRKQLVLSGEIAVTSSLKFADLGADSLDIIMIVMGLEEEFGITVEEEIVQAIATVQGVAGMIEKLVESKTT